MFSAHSHSIPPLFIPGKALRSQFSWTQSQSFRFPLRFILPKLAGTLRSQYKTLEQSPPACRQRQASPEILHSVFVPSHRHLKFLYLGSCITT